MEHQILLYYRPGEPYGVTVEGSIVYFGADDLPPEERVKLCDELKAVEQNIQQTSTDFEDFTLFTYGMLTIC